MPVLALASSIPTLFLNLLPWLDASPPVPVVPKVRPKATGSAGSSPAPSSQNFSSKSANRVPRFSKQPASVHPALSGMLDGFWKDHPGMYEFLLKVGPTLAATVGTAATFDVADTGEISFPLGLYVVAQTRLSYYDGSSWQVLAEFSGPSFTQSKSFLSTSNRYFRLD